MAKEPKKQLGKRNDSIGKKPDRKTSLTQYLSWEAIQRGGIKATNKQLVYSFLMKNRPQGYSARDLEVHLNKRETSLTKELKALLKAKQVSYVFGHHNNEFTERLVKKYFAIDPSEPQTKLF